MESERITDRTVADEYFAVTEKVEALYDQPRQLTADAEGNQMAKLRRDAHRRMLGNGYCTPDPVELDCHFEASCEALHLLRHHSSRSGQPSNANATTTPKANEHGRRSSMASSQARRIRLLTITCITIRSRADFKEPS